MRVGEGVVTPVSTDSFIFDVGRAVEVTLAKGITGYFVQGECGANCDDSRIFWVYGGYEFVIGIRGADIDAVTALANAVINNSIR